MQVRLQTDPTIHLHQHRAWALFFKLLSRRNLLDLIADPNRNVKNIDVRLDAMLHLQDSGYLRESEIVPLINLVRDEQDYPVHVDDSEIDEREEIEAIVGKNANITPQKLKKDIEENDANLRSMAALFLAEHDLTKTKHADLIPKLAQSIIEILDEMMADGIFVPSNGKPSRFFTNFLQALYWLEPASAQQFIDTFSSKELELKPVQNKRVYPA